LAQGKALSLHVLHDALWQRSDRRNAVSVSQGDLATEFGVNKFTMSRKVKALVDEGRIRRISNGRYLTGKFIVEDPDNFVRDDYVIANDDPFAP
jgi:predicted transcriptional regulator of viral defense system